MIAGFAELLAVRDDEQTRREAAQQILEASSRLSEAIDDVLEILAEDEQLAQGLLEARRNRRASR